MAFTEDPGLVLITHVRQHTTTYNSSSRGSDSLVSDTRHTQGTHTYVHTRRQNTHTHKMKKIKENKKKTNHKQGEVAEACNLSTYSDAEV